MLGRGMASDCEGWPSDFDRVKEARLSGKWFFGDDLALYSIAWYVILGGFPNTHAWTFHSAACAVFNMLLGTYFSHL